MCGQGSCSADESKGYVENNAGFDSHSRLRKSSQDQGIMQVQGSQGSRTRYRSFFSFQDFHISDGMGYYFTRIRYESIPASCRISPVVRPLASVTKVI